MVGQRHEVQTGPLTLAYLIGYWEISRQHLFGLLSRQTAVRGMIVMNVCVSGKPYPLGAPPPTLVRPPVSGAANARVAFSRRWLPRLPRQPSIGDDSIPLKILLIPGLRIHASQSAWLRKTKRPATRRPGD